MSGHECGMVRELVEQRRIAQRAGEDTIELTRRIARLADGCDECYEHLLLDLRIAAEWAVDAYDEKVRIAVEAAASEAPGPVDVVVSLAERVVSWARERFPGAAVVPLAAAPHLGAGDEILRPVEVEPGLPVAPAIVLKERRRFSFDVSVKPVKGVEPLPPYVELAYLERGEEPDSVRLTLQGGEYRGSLAADPEVIRDETAIAFALVYHRAD